MMRHRRRQAWRMVGRARLVAILAAGLLALHGVPAAWAPPAAAAAPAVPVHVAEVRSADMPVYLTGIGTVQAYNSVLVRAQVDGTIQEIRFHEGQAVRAGDLLAQIDPRPYQAAFDQAVAKKGQDEARLQNARLDLQRFAGIGDFASRQQVATQQSLVTQLEAQIRADQGAIDAAEAQLGYTRITAPIDGITGIRLVDAGNLARAAEATGIVVITQVQPISLIFTLPAEELGEVRNAMAESGGGGGHLQVTALAREGGRPLGEGTLELVDNQIDQATGTVRLKAILPNRDEALWPGQFVDARLLLRIERGVRTVPSTAVQRGPDGTWLYLVAADGTVAPQAVRVRRFAEGRAILEDGGPGLGTKVVASGQYRLAPGVRVQAIAPAEAAQASR
jgi:membrane fusion protein, multidrug efflux system